jgi:hypothetical protein
MNITITAKNAEDLDKFTPVEGTWRIDGLDRYDEHTVQDVEESIANWADAPYKIDVLVFGAGGRTITGDLPDHGIFLATRA